MSYPHPYSLDMSDVCIINRTPIDIVSPVIAALGVAAVAAVVDSSFLEQDEKDNVKIIKRSRGIYIFILFLCIKC